MGDRPGRSTERYENADLVAMTRKPIVGGTDEELIGDDDDPLADWEESEASPVAAGSQPEALPTTSRTATLSDPLTTGLLAEVARRSETMELDPATVESARRATQEIDPAELQAALRDSEQKAKAPAVTTAVTRRK